jgi:hypothetical protein
LFPVRLNSRLKTDPREFFQNEIKLWPRCRRGFFHGTSLNSERASSMHCVKVFSILVLLGGLGDLAARAAQPVWTGSDLNNLWGTSANWQGGTLPGDWDSVQFTNSSQKQLSNYCNIADLKITQINMVNPAADVIVGGSLVLGDSNGLRYGGGIDMSAATHDMTVQANVGFHAIQDWTVGPGRTLTATGAWSDDHVFHYEKTLFKNGLGTLVIGGSANNSNIYLQVNAGIAELAKTSSATVHAIAGINHIEPGATLRLAGSGGDQILDNSTIVDFFGTFDLNGRSEAVNAFSDNAAAGSIVTNSGNSDGTFIIGANHGTCTYPGKFTDGTTNKLALRKAGNGTFTPTNTHSTFTGGVYVGCGTLAVGSLADRGQPSVLGSDGTIVLESGAGAMPGVLQITGTNVSTNRNFAVATGGIIDIASGRLTIRGSLSGTVAGATLKKTGGGALQLCGNDSLNGPTVIAGGTLELAGGTTAAPSGNLALQAASTKLIITGGTHTFGNITGSGVLKISAGTLTASGIALPALTIGAARDAAPSASNPVPEPPAAVLLLLALGGGWLMRKRRLIDPCIANEH